jgi:hypothetical protein
VGSRAGTVRATDHTSANPIIQNAEF